MNVLLKPVTKSAIVALLSAVSEKARAAQTMSIDGLRADRDHILQCLFQTNVKLQEYDQERTHFLARAIHDFRAPLTAINGYCGLLLGGEDLGTLTEEQRQIIERMHRSAAKLSRMANAMFQLSLSPRAEQVPDFQPADVSHSIEQAVHEILPVAQDKRLTINVNMRPVGRPICFDRGKIEQVLVNLLENACKFAPRGGTIEVAGYPWHWDATTHRSGRPAEESYLQCEPNAYRVDVVDSGPGVPQAHIGKIFEEYTSYAGGSDRSGGGLGLAICRMILRQHQGCIWTENSAAGATFSFVLPLNRERSGQHDTGDRINNVRSFVAHQNY
jgi:two-component system phosphate regulon sensor histidine kinase PhoR